MAVTKWKGFYDIVILPSEEVKRQAIELSGTLARYGSRWELGSHERIPHLSLLHIPVASENLSAFIQRAGHLIAGAGVASPVLRTTRIKIRKIHGAVFLMTNRPLWLPNLAKSLALGLAPYRDKKYDLAARWGALTPNMQENFRRYGTPMMGSDFEPHFTLATFEEKERAWTASRGLEVKPLEFPAGSLHLCPLADGFTCLEPIAEFKLKDESKKAPAA